MDDLKILLISPRDHGPISASPPPPSGLFKAQTFYDMMDRLWAAIFDLMLRMSNLFKERISGEIDDTLMMPHMRQSVGSAPYMAMSYTLLPAYCLRYWGISTQGYKKLKALNEHVLSPPLQASSS